MTYAILSDSDLDLVRLRMPSGSMAVYAKRTESSEPAEEPKTQPKSDYIRAVLFGRQVAVRLQDTWYYRSAAGDFDAIEDAETLALIDKVREV